MFFCADIKPVLGILNNFFFLMILFKITNPRSDAFSTSIPKRAVLYCDAALAAAALVVLQHGRELLSRYYHGKPMKLGSTVIAA